MCFVSEDSVGNAITATRRILRGFPNSQHRPIIIDVGLKLPLIRLDERNRWNFGKADWEKFSETIDSTILRIPANASNYHRFLGLIIFSAKQSIPRGHRNVIIPGWSKESQELFDSFQETGNVETGKQLLKELDQNRRLELETKVESISFTRSSKKAWNLINRLSGKSSKSAAYDTVWKRGLLLNLSAIIPCRKALTLMMSILSDRCIQMEINGRNSSKRILNNGLPQSSRVFYTVYIPATFQTLDPGCMSTDDIDIAFQAKNF